MSRLTRRLLQGAIAVAIAGTALVVTSAPAHAVQVGCHILPPRTGCGAGPIPASPDHWIKLRVNVPLYGEVTCRVHDNDNNIEVGRASRASWMPSWAFKQITIKGLYASYYMVCVNTSKRGSGSIWNH